MVETRTIGLPVTLPKGFEDCERCASRLIDALSRVNGIHSVDIDARSSTLTLSYDPYLVPLEEVKRRAHAIGADLSKRFSHRTFNLAGLDCPDCAFKIEKAVGRMDGVLWVSASFPASKMSVEYESEKVDASAIQRRIRTLGYRVSEKAPVQRGAPREAVEVMRASRWFLRRQTLLTVTAGAGILLGLVLGMLDIPIASRAAYAVSTAAGGIYAARGAYYSLRSLALDMNFLMTVAVIGALAIGEWFDAAMVMFLFSLGNALEQSAVERARESIATLVNLAPTTARVIRDEGEIDVPTSEVRSGDLFVVRPGEKIATDGVIEKGSSTINESAITGEPLPVEKSVNDTVFAGSLNERGFVTVRATADANDNTLSRIIHLVEEAQAEKAPSQRITEVFGRVYTPIVVCLAGVIAVALPVFFTVEFRDSLYRALTLLVVSCPCALVISTPASVVSAIANAARNGVLVKGGSHLEAAGGLEVVAFDKTGTLTTGKPQLTDIYPSDGLTEEVILSIAASVEAGSEHPLAAAIVAEAYRKGIEIREVSEFVAHTGTGASGRLGKVTYMVGSQRLIKSLGFDTTDWSHRIDVLQGEGKTVVLVASQQSLLGLIALSDTIRDSAFATVSELRRAGIARTVMITGDAVKTAEAVALELEIDECYAGLLPEDKVDVVRSLRERFGNVVAVVGDGVNDAPAIAASTVGIAMGAAGSPTALETADIALMADELTRLPFTIRLSRRFLRTVRQNIAFSLAVIGVLVTAALTGRLNLSIGVLGHEGSALIVIANALRLLRFK